MSTTVKISGKLKARIASVKAKAEGRLYGISSNGPLLLALSLNESIENNLPINVQDLGRLQCVEGIASEPDDKDIDNLIISYNIKTKELSIKIKDASNVWSEASLEEVSDADIGKDWICLRTKFTLKYNIDSSRSCKEQLTQFLEDTKMKLCDSNKPVIKVNDTEIVLKKNKAFAGIAKSTKVSSVLKQTKNAEAQKADPSQFEVLNFTISPDDENIEDFSSMFGNITLDEGKTTIDIDFDALALVKVTSAATSLYDNVLKSIDRNIAQVAASLTDVARSLHTFVFYPRAAGHFISFIYPTAATDDDPNQIEQRKKIYENLYLVQVCLRRDDQYNFDPQPSQPHLINPHIGLKSLVKNGKQYIVQGEYAYHHYMQDNFNDDGWGCAYRSFQTVFSWYRLQGYTNKPVPTHAEIQQCLIDLGDKPATFLNSRQWIGSMEVAMCLQHFIGVDARIVHVRSGADMAQHGATFAQHFTTYGTPVMIGGGVLAHTILGVDFNSQTNDLKFLVLDPHYTGDDDLATVQKKGWCGWKAVTFWNKKSYYNFCMPVFPFITDY